jgi:hypothetical protein
VSGEARLECVFELEKVAHQIDDDGAGNDDYRGPQERRSKSRTRVIEPRFVAPVLGHGQSLNSYSCRTAILRCDLDETSTAHRSYARHLKTQGIIRRYTVLVPEARYHGARKGRVPLGRGSGGWETPLSTRDKSIRTPGRLP